MKKIITTVIVIVCIAIIACLALPKYYSSQNKLFVQNFLNGVQQGSKGQITGKIISETDGWFSSTSQIEFNYQINDTNFNNKLVQGQINLQLNIKHGPILLTANGLRLGQAYFDYTLLNNPQSAAYFSNPLLNGSALVSFSGNTQFNFSGFKTIVLPELQFDGMTGTAALNQNVTKLKGKINFGQLQINEKNKIDNKIVVAPFTQTFDLTRANVNDIWSGDKNLDIPSIVIQSSDVNGQFNNVSIKSNVNLDQKFLNGNLDISAPDFTINKQHGNYHAVLTLTNLKAAAFNQIRALADGIDFQKASAAEIQQYSTQLAQNIVNIFSGNSAIQFNSTLNFGALGSFILNTGYDNHAQTSKITFIAKIVRENNNFAGIDLSVAGLDKSALGSLLHLGISLNPAINPAAAQQLQNPEALRTTINNLMTQLFTPASQLQLNIVMPNDKKTGFQLLNAKAYFNTLPPHPTTADLMTTAQLDANWKIPTYATEMLKVFAPAIINKIDDPSHQADAAEAYKLFEQMLPLMIQQGYLVQQGNYYVSNWNINNKAVLMNNKSLQPLIVQLMKLHQQQQTTPAATSNTAPVTAPTDTTVTAPVPQ